MLTFTEDIFALLAPFAPLFSRGVWSNAPILVDGALLVPGRRMLSSVLRTVGLGAAPTSRTARSPKWPPTHSWLDIGPFEGEAGEKRPRFENASPLPASGRRSPGSVLGQACLRGYILG
jgi:hypothetical protein